MRILLAVAVLISGCCGVAEETRDLAWGVTQYQRSQAVQVEQLATAAVAKDAIAAEEAQEIIATQKALVDSCQSLLEILGMPETTPELPGVTAPEVTIE